MRWEFEGTMLDGCFGWEGVVPEGLKPCILQSFLRADYAPSAFVHGLADEVVPAEESVYHHGQLQRLGLRVSSFWLRVGLMGFGVCA